VTPFPASIDDDVRASLLWGAVGGLSFLVLIQGYRLTTGERVTPGAIVGVTLVVTAVAAVLSHAARRRNERD